MPDRTEMKMSTATANRPTHYKYGCTARLAARVALLLLIMLGGVQGLAAQEIFIIKDISFRGNHTFADSDLRMRMLLRERGFFQGLLFWKTDDLSHEFSEVILQRDLRRLTNFYNSEGFLHARIDSFNVDLREKNETAYITIFITEGDPIIVRSLNFELVAQNELDRQRANEFLSYDREQLQLAIGRRYRDEALQLDRDFLYRKLANGGYPYTNIEVTPRLDRTNNIVDLSMRITLGPLSRFGEVTVEGNEMVPASMIVKQIAFDLGDQYSQDAVQRTQAQVYQIGLFQYVTVQVLFSREQSPTLPVRIEVKESPSFTLRFGVGYGTEEKLRLSTDSQFFNLGGARRLDMTVSRSDLVPVNLNATLTQPSFPEARTFMSVNPFFKRENEQNVYKVERFGANVSARRKLGWLTEGFIGYTLERVEQLEIGGVDVQTINAPQDSNLYNKSAITLGISRDSSQPVFAPTQGTNRSGTITVSGLGFNSVSFVRLFFDYRKYMRLSQRPTVLAFRVKAGGIKTYGGDATIPPVERFYAGGSNSVRGWQRLALGPEDKSGNPIGGNILLETSVEVRFPFWGSFSGTIFMDAGNVWNDKITSHLAYALGVGLRYETMVGPIRFDIGKPIFDDSALSPAFHISFGHAF